MGRPDSAATRLATTVVADRERIAAGERPRYHVTCASSPFDDSADVQIVELPIVHLFVPDSGRILDGARVLIARTLGVAPDTFDVAFEAEVGARRATP